jgi:glycosyltransferase involved in cell wall biosynthesis
VTAVAIFTTYAPSEGFGGPARTYHQRRVLEDAGYAVTHVVLQPTAERGNVRSHDICELVERPYRAPIDHIYNDVDLGERASADRRLVDRVTSRLRNRNVTALVLEQPFLVGVVEQVAAALDAPVLYSCQNIEWRLRADLERFQPDHRRASNRSAEVLALEQRAVDLSAAITTICPHDRAQLETEFGRSSTLVANGSEVAELAIPRPRHRADGARFAFAGSAYWPNIEGFAEIATPSLAFLPPTTRIDIAGTVGSEIMRSPAILRHQSANASRITTHGFVSMVELVELMSSSDAVIVPVFIGEGSNLKSADALASGARVIMSERAVRGYEDVIHADPEGVIVVDTAPEFRSAMRSVIDMERPASTIGQERRRMLAWSTRLQPLIEVVDGLTATRREGGTTPT